MFRWHILYDLITFTFTVTSLMGQIILVWVNVLQMSRLIGKDPDAGKDWRQKKRVAEDEHNRLNGHEFEQTLGDSERQRRLVCCSLWGITKSQMWLTNWKTTVFHIDLKKYIDSWIHGILFWMEYSKDINKVNLVEYLSHLSYTYL